MHYLCNVLFKLAALESTIYSSVRFYALLARVSFISYFSKWEKKYFLKERASRIKPLNTNRLIQSPFSIFYLLQPHCLVFTLKLNQSDELLLALCDRITENRISSLSFQCANQASLPSRCISEPPQQGAVQGCSHPAVSLTWGRRKLPLHGKEQRKGQTIPVLLCNCSSFTVQSMQLISYYSWQSNFSSCTM